MPSKRVVAGRSSSDRSVVTITWKWLFVASVASLVLSFVASHYFLSSNKLVVSKHKHAVLKVDETDVIIVDDFFPIEKVVEWRTRMEAEWRAGNWFFTTNNDGTKSFWFGSVVFCSMFLFFGQSSPE